MTPTRPAGLDGFRSRIVSRTLNACTAHVISAPSHDAERRPPDIASDGRDDLHLTLMLRGVRGIDIAGRSTTARAGTLFMAPSWRPHRLLGVGSRYTGVRVAFPTTPIARWRAEQLIAEPGRLDRSALAPVLRVTCLAIARSLRTLEDHDLKALLGASASMVSALVERPDQPGACDDQTALYLRALMTMEASASEWDFDLGSLARMLDTSPRRIQRALAAHGETFSDARRRLRLERARRALLEDRRPVQQLAFDSGYSELSAFYRAFRRAYGLTPGLLRGLAR
ncbi:helix-turn-helix domain-containing protein [Elioraea sp.]|uniref:helix-turn-helix transcriptional regulator n=1 Tax=Elioraea sp. TaxID=2185103 RepID=UPI003F71222D